MATFAGALVPIFLLILFGQGLRRGGLVADPVWAGIDRMTYFLFFPCLIVNELARADLGRIAALPMGTAMAAGVLAAAGLVLALRRSIGLDGPAFSSVFQGVMRPNTYVGLAAASALYGAEGLTLTAVGIAVVVPLVNLLCVPAMVRYGRGAGSTGAAAVANGIVRNPIIIAVALGAALNAGGLGHLPVMGDVVAILARAALPVGLLSVGAGLDLGAARGAGMGVALSAALKLLVVPGLTAAAGLALGLGGPMLTVAVLFNALPCSASSYALARQMGGDHRLMAGIITVQTLLSALTLPLVLALAG
ncbi:AEC family transporter [Azospirillum isscasi]|uniref:AEC family transporter n=1 Tax=Azospirillum isscasi TaxID=3053926 RepID=A0ABU0WC34_9PROT|nr:AEC family transporter [Azospirillum isscasi]MDQ2101743.1 AEC family transporter [Azospirillum isscasi]